jgi:hypothetical protein
MMAVVQAQVAAAVPYLQTSFVEIMILVAAVEQSESAAFAAEPVVVASAVEPEPS